MTYKQLKARIKELEKEAKIRWRNNGLYYDDVCFISILVTLGLYAPVRSEYMLCGFKCKMCGKRVCSCHEQYNLFSYFIEGKRKGMTEDEICDLIWRNAPLPRPDRSVKVLVDNAKATDGVKKIERAIQFWKKIFRL